MRAVVAPVSVAARALETHRQRCWLEARASKSMPVRPILPATIQAD